MNTQRVLGDDHSYVRFIECWGHGEACQDEAGIIEAARMSTGKGFEGWEKDEKLLKFLYANKHMTPFEMAGMTIEIGAPIFVFREWHRHRTQSYNEMSARYIPLPNENYSPSLDLTMHRIQEGLYSNNKQAQGATRDMPPIQSVESWLNLLRMQYARAEEVYQMGLALGVPKELARLPVPVARYSRMRASGNLRNWLAFLTLRMAPNAQWEIRQYANAVGKLISTNFPRTWNLFEILG